MPSPSMGFLDALVLALLQGVTEFLPVSSSGHLVLVQQWLSGLGEVDIFYDVLLHLATALAVIVFLRREVVALLRGVLRPGGAGAGPLAGHERRITGYLLLASIPTGVVGLALDRFLFERLTRVDIVGGMLLLTGGVLWLGRGRGRGGGRGPGAMRARDALILGLIQGIAVIPGVSRSGVTITGGILLGLERDLAARFSLLVSLPAILGATLLKTIDALEGPLPPLGPYAAGMAAAFGVGLASIAIILRMVRRDQFHLCAWYLWPLGAAVILWYHVA